MNQVYYTSALKPSLQVLDQMIGSHQKSPVYFIFAGSGDLLHVTKCLSF